MRVRSLAPRLCMGAALALSSSPARADPAPSAAGETRPEDSAGAVVVLIGEVGERKALGALLVELLGRQSVPVRFLAEPRFEPSHLFSGGEGDASVWVFVELPSVRAARLFFRGPRAQRFLLRDLELRDGLDDFGRELVGQVVESSVAALLHSSAGLSREQARKALAETGAPAVPATPPRDTAKSGTAPTGDARWAGWLGLRYAAGWTGSDLGAQHGPGIEVGVEWRGPALLRGTFTAEGWFSQQVSSPQVDATIQGWPLRLTADVGLPAGVGRGPRWLLGFGGGFDVIRVDPHGSLDPAVAPAASRTRLVPMMRAEGRFELSAGIWRLAFLAFADVSLVDTHYDLGLGSGVERVAVPWPVRPGLAFVAAWQPALTRP